MDFSDGIENLYPFPDKIFIECRASAIEYATRIFDGGEINRCLVMWVDGSVQSPPRCDNLDVVSASAVGWLDFSSNTWTESVAIASLKHSFGNPTEAELIAIYEAFRIACDQVDTFDRLILFSDSQCALKGLRDHSSFPFLPEKDAIYSILRCANQLYDVGVDVELRWVPGHSRVIGNVRVDKLARQSRRATERHFLDGRWRRWLQNIVVTAESSEHLRKNLQKLTRSRLHEQGKAIVPKKRVRRLT
jgi:ribonuclease HI